MVNSMVKKYCTMGIYEANYMCLLSIALECIGIIDSDQFIVAYTCCSGMIRTAINNNENIISIIKENKIFIHVHVLWLSAYHLLTLPII